MSRAGDDKEIRRIAPLRTLAAEMERIMAKRALITGITGQDGSYRAELLLANGY